MTDDQEETAPSEEPQSDQSPERPEEPADIPVEDVAASPSDKGSLLGGQLDMLAGVAGTTTRIVTRATNILEEELAVGIGATQDLEKRLFDVEKLRSTESQEVIQRFRKDAHDLVDILIDLVNVATNAATSLQDRAISIGIGQPSKPAAKPPEDIIPSLVAPGSIKPGSAVDIPMTLKNESDKPTEAFQFHSSDLVNSDGQHISAQQIRFQPEKMVIDPHQDAVVTVTVSIPEDTPPGTYSGLLQAARMEQLRAVLTVNIN